MMDGLPENEIHIKSYVTAGGKSGSMSWNFEAGTSKSGSVISAGAGAGGVNQMGSAGNTKGGVSWDQIRQQVQLQVIILDFLPDKHCVRSKMV